MSDIEYAPPSTADAQEHRLRGGALSLAGNIGLALASSGPTVSIALTLAAIVGATGAVSYAGPITILVVALPMLGIAAAFKYLNRSHVNCGATYMWGAKAVSPYYGFMVGWIIFLAYFVGVISVALPIGTYLIELVSGGGSPVWEAVIGSLAVIAVTTVAYIGIRVAAWLQWVLIAIEYIGIGLLIVFSLVAVLGHHAGTTPMSWSWFSWHELGGVHGFIAGSMIAVYMFSGWDSGIMVNEETENPGETPGNSVMLSVIVLAVLYAFCTFAFQGAVPNSGLQQHSDNALSYIAHQVAGSPLEKYMILAVGLSAIGSTLATLVSAVREVFAMAADSVLPKTLGKTHPRFKTPTVATVIIGVLCVIGTWVYVLGSASVQNSFDTIINVDGLLFAMFYVCTGLTMLVYFRRAALTGVRKFILLLLFPLASTAFLVFLAVKSVPGLGGWGSSSMIAVYVLLAAGAVIMVVVKAKHAPSYFSIRREVFTEEVSR